jgi:hypothetical protein
LLARTQPALPLGATYSATFATLERHLVVHSDAAEIVEYLRSAYRRACTSPPADEGAPIDEGCILTTQGQPWLWFNGAPVQYLEEPPSTTFRLAFYGSSKLLRLSFQQNPAWHSLYAAALRIGDKAIVISAQSGIGKTTLALELMARGASFFSDEFVFVRAADKMVSGLARCMLIRERTLSLFGDPRLRTVCAATRPRLPYGDRVWDDIDPRDVFGEQVFARPARLAAAIILERSLSTDKTHVEPIPSMLAAADFGKRLNTTRAPFDRLADAGLMLSGIACYRVTGGSPRSAAMAIEAVL